MYSRVNSQLLVLFWKVLESLEVGGLAGGSRSQKSSPWGLCLVLGSSLCLYLIYVLPVSILVFVYVYVLSMSYLCLCLVYVYILSMSMSVCNCLSPSNSLLTMKWVVSVICSHLHEILLHHKPGTHQDKDHSLKSLKLWVEPHFFYLLCYFCQMPYCSDEIPNKTQTRF